ncbi:MAG: hypothetical protein BWY10_02407 [Chloroflexi bacterium ADurb.Bin180]|nr:MAG: hypothetical protein BWY10_02407 [Chloroflexi bacterium ADurb.Bin180]
MRVSTVPSAQVIFQVAVFTAGEPVLTAVKTIPKVTLEAGGQGPAQFPNHGSCGVTAAGTMASYRLKLWIVSLPAFNKPVAKATVSPTLATWLEGTVNRFRTLRWRPCSGAMRVYTHTGPSRASAVPGAAAAGSGWYTVAQFSAVTPASSTFISRCTA